MHHVLIVVSNFPADFDVAALLRGLLECRLVACGNILPAVQSIFRWQGAIESALESTLVLKTTADRYPDVEAALLAAHPYDVPEILALPVSGGLPAYLAWVQQESRKDVDV
jgi:periplasmic divalent cation tolerance protein